MPTRVTRTLRDVTCNVTMSCEADTINITHQPQKITVAREAGDDNGIPASQSFHRASIAWPSIPIRSTTPHLAVRPYVPWATTAEPQVKGSESLIVWTLGPNTILG